jgi:hypothetical protein
MKRSLALFLLALFCCRTGFARVDNRYLAQFYDGEARPRGEVAWIWGINPSVTIDRIDDTFFGIALFHSGSPTWFQSNASVVEILPGKHVISLSYFSGDGPATLVTIYSKKDYELQIDVKGGENYVIDADPRIGLRDSSWNATFKPFTPPETGINLQRRTVERSVSIDGVFQSSKRDRLRGFRFVITPIEGLQKREFQCLFNPKLQEGQRIKVLYYASRPDFALAIDPIQ